MNKKTLFLSVSLLLVVVAGVFVGKFFLSSPDVSKTTIDSVNNGPAVIDTSESIVVAPSISVYSEAAVAIVVGTVTDVADHYAEIDVSEVIKGDTSIKTVSVLLPGAQIEDTTILKPDENDLLFLCKNGDNEYVVCGESAGKCLIDKNNNVIGASAFTMSLEDLKAKILDALKNLNTK